VADKDYRTISRDYPDGSRIIAVLQTGGEADTKTDDEILDGLQQWKREQQHLHPVDDEQP
jgi:hypothetical protein